MLLQKYNGRGCHTLSHLPRITLRGVPAAFEVYPAHRFQSFLVWVVCILEDEFELAQFQNDLVLVQMIGTPWYLDRLDSEASLVWNTVLGVEVFAACLVALILCLPLFLVVLYVSAEDKV